MENMAVPGAHVGAGTGRTGEASSCSQTTCLTHGGLTGFCCCDDSAMKLEEIGPNLLLHESAFQALILDVGFVGPRAPLAQCPYWGHV